MASPTILLPGDTLQAPSSATLKLGTNLHLLSTSQQQRDTATQNSSTPPSQLTIASAQAGLLSSDTRRPGAFSIIPFRQCRYTPATNDLVVAQIHHSSQELYYCVLSPHSPHASLDHFAFEGATKKTRPQLRAGDLVYARVLSTGVGPGGEAELVCVNPATGKAEPDGLGPLSGGMVYNVSTMFASRLMMTGSHQGGGVVVLEELGRKLEGLGGFEVAVGRNGKVWVDCPASEDDGVKIIVAIGRCLQEVDDRGLDAVEQKRLVSRILREMELL